MKVLAFLLSLALMLCLAGCGSASVEQTTIDQSSQTADETTKPVTAPETPKTPAGNGGMRGGPGGRGGMMGGGSNDPEIQAVLQANADKFMQFTYDDPDTGLSLEYSLYIPEGYDGSTELPLLMFIPDSTGAGKTAKQIVEQ